MIGRTTAEDTFEALSKYGQDLVDMAARGKIGESP